MRIHLIIDLFDAGPAASLLKLELPYQVSEVLRRPLGAGPGLEREGLWVRIDLQLPWEQGVGLISDLRRAHPHIGVVVTDAGRNALDSAAGYDAGADIFSNEPVGREELDAMVEAVLRRRVRHSMASGLPRPPSDRLH